MRRPTPRSDNAPRPDRRPRAARSTRTSPTHTTTAGTASEAGPRRPYVRRQERRVELLDAAAELFATRGFAGTTTRDIAAAVGTTETVLFRHFPTKEALYAAILEHRVPSAGLDHLLGELTAMAARNDDAALFGRVVAVILESFRSDRVYHRLMLYAMLEGHPLARLAHSTYNGPFLAMLRDYVAKRQAQGAFRRMRPEWVVHVLVAATTHFALWNAIGVNALGLTEREVASQVVSLVMGLRSPGPRKPDGA